MKALVRRWGEREGLAAALYVLLVLVAVLAGTLAVGCGGKTDTTGGAAQTQSIFTYAMESVPYGVLDPLQDATTVMVHQNVYETLTYYDSKTGEVQPALATSWENSTDGKTWTFHLREGVTFHDGSSLDSHAVKFSVSRVQEMKVGAYYVWDSVKSISTPDDMTVVFHLGTAAPIDLVASSSYSAYIISPTAVEKYGDKCFEPGYDAGSGPYTLHRATLTEATMERYDDYWGGWEGTHAKAPTLAVFRQIQEPAVRVQNLEQGEVQLISSAQPADIERLKTNKSLREFPSTSFNQIWLFLNTKKAPTNDNNLREAIYYAYPYKQAVDVVFAGYGAIGTSPVPTGMWGHDEIAASFPAPSQDMARAREALAKSAYPDGGVTLVCYANNSYDSLLKSLELWKVALAELNIKLDVLPKTTATIYDVAFSDNPPQNIVAEVWGPAYTNGVANYKEAFQSDPPVYNFSYISDPKVDALLKKADIQSATDRAAATKTMIEMSDVLQPQYGMLFPLDFQAVSISTAALKGFEGFNPAYRETVWVYDVWLGE